MSQTHGDGSRTSASGITEITKAEADPIAAALREMYTAATSEPLPDKLTQLLDQLEAAEKRR